MVMSTEMRKRLTTVTKTHSYKEEEDVTKRDRHVALYDVAVLERELRHAMKSL